MKWLKNLFNSRNRYEFTQEDRDNALAKRELAKIERKQLELINMKLKEQEEQLKHKIQQRKIERLNTQLKALEEEDEEEYEDDEEEYEDDEEEDEIKSPVDTFMEFIGKLNSKPDLVNNNNITITDLSDEDIKKEISKFDTKDINTFKKLNIDSQKSTLKKYYPNYSDISINKAINIINQI